MSKNSCRYFFFNTADELNNFVINEFQDDGTKIYAIIPVQNLQKMQRCNKGVPIDGCQKSQIISLFPDGTFQLRRRLCNCSSCLMGQFNECLLEIGEDVNIGIFDFDDIEEEVNELDETDNAVLGDSFGFAEAGNYIALYSSNSFELFYLFYVTMKEVAIESKTDIYGHIVQEGECYLEGYYLEKVRETNQRVFYKKLKKSAYVHPQAMFCPNVSLNEELMCMEKIDYVTLSHFMFN